MAKGKIHFIFHFRPLENYPPIQNLLAFLNRSEEIEKVCCFSTVGQLKRIGFGKKVKIYRWGILGSTKIGLWLTYLIYNLFSISFLIFRRPSIVLYFESLSAFPVYFYKRFVNPNLNVFIHYHEYISVEDYKKASPIVRFYHAKEKFLYPKAVWISHTNQVRLSKFLADEKLNYDPDIHRIMPNYPSQKWVQTNKKWKSGETLKMIFVGYTATQVGSYLKELVDYLAQTGISTELSLYCLQENEFLDNLEGKYGDLNVVKKKAIPNSDLPQVLTQHHIGLILYKAKSLNYIHNAPNKLFEYLSCGLDVWYPEEMQGIYPYDSNIQPKVLRLDFKQLVKYNIKELISETETQNKFTYFAENVYKVFLKHFLNEYEAPIS